MVEEITDYEILEIAVRELAIERGLFTAEDHRRFTEWAESIGPINGSRLVAKAWTDPAFKARVLEDGVKACKELGLDWAEPTGFGTPSDYTNFIVLEDTPTLHHVIVCTLCSCYPRPILGMSPEWYRTTNYRRRLVRWPREVLAEFGLILRPRWRLGSRTQIRSAASWFFRSGRTAPRIGRRSNSRRSSHETA
jgi:hypothetical protein